MSPRVQTPAKPGAAEVLALRYWDAVHEARVHSRKAGREEGLRDGHVQGWRWGFACGAFWATLGAAGAAALARWMGWL